MQMSVNYKQRSVIVLLPNFFQITASASPVVMSVIMQKCHKNKKEKTKMASNNRRGDTREVKIMKRMKDGSFSEH